MPPKDGKATDAEGQETRASSTATESFTEEQVDELTRLDLLGSDDGDSGDDSPADDKPKAESGKTGKTEDEKPGDEPAKAAGEKPEEATARDEPAGPSPEAIERARELGIPAKVARAFEDDDELDAFLETLLPEDDSGEPTEDKPEAKPDEPKADDKPPVVEIDRDKFDDGTVEIIDKVNGVIQSLHGRLKTLEKENAELKTFASEEQQIRAAEQTLRVQQKFDEALNALGISELGTETPKKDTAEWKRRKSLWHGGFKTVSELTVRSKRKPSFEEGVRRALVLDGYDLPKAGKADGDTGEAPANQRKPPLIGRAAARPAHRQKASADSEESEDRDAEEKRRLNLID